ncbi:MAG: hypothetical protein CL912_17605 [Deltaproteobacteria bacterium]|nr:hypothetical protein [Deltaproteobacteria bacterium]|tara:strand:- start:660 stop:1478 length:819 start_codon:yes stop_codon:yes gene_type:complete
MQPKVEPSPCLRKSTVPQEVAYDMYPLGLAKIFNLKTPKSYIGWEELVPVYGGNPFAQALKNRTHTKNPYNKNDLSDLKDIPTRAAKRDDDFVQVDRGVEKLVILRNKEDPRKHLDAPGQPKYIEVPLAKVRKSGCIFAKLLDEIDKGKKSLFHGNSILYSFDSAPKPNIHIQHCAVYVDGFMTSDFARASQGYYRVQSLTSRHLWTGIRIWGFWMASFSFQPSYTEEETKNAMLVGSFIGDPLYCEDLHKMVVARGYHHSYPIVGALASII